MQWNNGFKESVHTFANTINTHEGGTHEEGFRAALTSLMILLFLGSWRSTVIVLISIPLCVMTSLAVLAALSIAPAATLKAGGVGVRELRRVARAAGLEEAELPLLLEVLAAAGATPVSGTPIDEADFRKLLDPRPARRHGGTGRARHRRPPVHRDGKAPQSPARRRLGSLPLVLSDTGRGLS